MPSPRALTNHFTTLPPCSVHSIRASLLISCPLCGHPALYLGTPPRCREEPIPREAWTVSDWFPQLSLHMGLGHWTAAPLLGTICPELGGQMLVWGEADGEEFTLVWGALAVHPHPALPGDLKKGQQGWKARVPSGPCLTSKDRLRVP